PDMLTTGGDIRVTAARRSAKAPADSPGNEPQRGELATIRVTDAGDGSMARAFAQPVAPASSESLFGDALRLGRSVTAQIVDAHGGWIEAAAVPGRGSSVVICLPLHVVTGAPPAVEPDVACGPGPVLIADDDPMIVALLRTVLEGRGHQIVGTTTAGECVIALEQHTTTLGAVLLDHNLPRVRGATVFEHVRRIAPDVPVVLISGGLLDPESAPPSEDERTCRLAKPFMPADVLEALRSVCRSPAESVDS
ncbi:MAG: response regulator, partial [bacterium]|nr:response regulator [bacterium]